MPKKTRIVHGTELPEAFCDNMTGCTDEGRDVDVVYLDFILAFDTIPCEILKGKLRNGRLAE